MKRIFVYAMPVLLMLFLAACGGGGGSPDLPDLPADETGFTPGSTERQVPLDMDETPHFIEQIPTVEPIETIVSRYKARNDELLDLVFQHMAGFSAYFQSIYIPIPPDLDLQHTTIEELVDSLAMAAISDISLGNFGTAVELFDILFNAPTGPSMALMSYATAEVVPYTTILNYFYSRGYVTEADISLVQDAFGNFMQRIGAIQETGGNPARYRGAHNDMLDLYSRFWANAYIVDFLENLPAGVFPIPCEDTVSHLSEYLDAALYDVQHFINATRRIYALPLFFDKPRGRQIERSYGLIGLVLGIPFKGVLGALTAPNIEVIVNQSQSVVYSNIMNINNFATETLNPGIAQLNVKRRSINHRAELFQNMLYDPEAYLPVFAALEVVPEKENLLNFIPYLYEFDMSMRVLGEKADIIHNLFLSTFSASPERDAYFNQARILNRFWLRGNADPEHENWTGLSTITVTDYNIGEISSYVNSRVDPVRIRSIWLLYNVIVEWGNAEFSSDTGIDFSQRNISAMFIRHANNHMWVGRMRMGHNEPTIMILEFIDTGTLLSPVQSPAWFTLYCPRVRWPVFTECLATNNFALFDRDRVLHASPGWYDRGEDWIYHNIQRVLLDLCDMVHNLHGMNTAEYFHNFNRRR